MRSEKWTGAHFFYGRWVTLVLTFSTIMMIGEDRKEKTVPLAEARWAKGRAVGKSKGADGGREVRPVAASKIRSAIPETQLDEAYLLILARRPTAGDLARELRVSESKLGQLLRRLSASVRNHGLLVHRAGRGDRRVLEIRTIEDPTRAAPLDPRTLRARRLPPRRPGLKPEDEIIYARDW